MGVDLKQSRMTISRGADSVFNWAGGWSGRGVREAGLADGVHTCEQVESRVSGQELGIERFFRFLEVRGEGPLCSTTRC